MVLCIQKTMVLQSFNTIMCIPNNRHCYRNTFPACLCMAWNTPTQGQLSKPSLFQTRKYLLIIQFLLTLQSHSQPWTWMLNINLYSLKKQWSVIITLTKYLWIWKWLSLLVCQSNSVFTIRHTNTPKRTVQTTNMLMNSDTRRCFFKSLLI